jgi:hypothetical protein
MTTKKDIFELFQSMLKHTYKKKGKFLFRKAAEGETVLTVVSGKLETMKVAGIGDIVLRNIEVGSSAETYIVQHETFLKRYDVASAQIAVVDGVEWGFANAKGVIQAAEYTGGDEIRFEAPWGEEMILQKGDFLANPVGGQPEDIYRIERATFDQTYFRI